MIQTLVLDTSTERGMLALIQNGSVLFHSKLPFGLQNSQFLLPELQRGFLETGLDMRQLTFIGVGIGPGSYTGIRVAATVAKTLAFACHLPLIGVCTLETFVPEQDTAFAAIIDAKVGGVYLQKGACTRGVISYHSAPQVLPLAEAVDLLCDVPVLITPNAVQLKAKLGAMAPAATWQWQECYPSPLHLAALAQAKFKSGAYDKEGALDLLYMRKTQAEIERDLRLNR